MPGLREAKTDSITRGALARLTGCNKETVRYYENIGMLPAPNRSAAGYRLYDQEHVKRLQFILRAKKLGFSSGTIQSLLDVSDGGDQATRAEVKALTETHIEEVTEKIRDLQELKDRLVEISSHCDGARESAAQCPILITLFDEQDAKA